MSPSLSLSLGTHSFAAHTIIDPAEIVMAAGRLSRSLRLLLVALPRTRSAWVRAHYPNVPAIRQAHIDGVRCCASFTSRSTAREEEEQYHAGSEDRARELGAKLSERGFELTELLPDPRYRGSAALRTYNSFVFPKSSGALANACKPGRVDTIAQSICFLAREQRAEEADWLRNHDRALAEAAQCTTRHPLHLVLDNVRSAHNVGNLFRAAEAAQLECIHACGVTPVPPSPKLMKTAMGSAEYVKHAQDGSTLRVVRELQAQADDFAHSWPRSAWRRSCAAWRLSSCREPLRRFASRSARRRSPITSE